MRDTAEQVLPSCHPLDIIHLAKVIVGEFRSAEFLSLLDILLVFVNHFVSQRLLIKIYKSFGSSDLFFILFTTKNLEDNFCLVFFCHFRPPIGQCRRLWSSDVIDYGAYTRATLFLLWSNQIIPTMQITASTSKGRTTGMVASEINQRIFNKRNFLTHC